jgi:hypothetical protein
MHRAHNGLNPSDAVLFMSLLDLTSALIRSRRMPILFVFPFLRVSRMLFRLVSLCSCEFVFVFVSSGGHSVTKLYPVRTSRVVCVIIIPKLSTEPCSLFYRLDSGASMFTTEKIGLGSDIIIPVCI